MYKTHYKVGTVANCHRVDDDLKVVITTRLLLGSFGHSEVQNAGIAYLLISHSFKNVVSS
jgi:hypothetical protein